jgi:DtxR family Mn-dependent transcriptional regulator
MHTSNNESSTSMQDYLKAVAATTGDGERVTTTQISRYLKIASPSVTSMFKKLSKQGYATYRPYYGITLTAMGIKEAKKVSRKHMLLETLFADILHINTGGVHEQACAMEHALLDEVEIALCRYLHHPDKCPDGRVMPACDKQCSSCKECTALNDRGLTEVKRRSENLSALCELQAGVVARVSFIRAESPDLERIFSMGLVLGAQITVKTVTDETIEVNVGDSNVLLGKDVAAKVFLELA